MQDNLLPLKKDLKRIAVIGPNANIARIGDYTSSRAIKDLSEFGIFNQVEKIISPGTEVQFNEEPTSLTPWHWPKILTWLLWVWAKIPAFSVKAMTAPI